jgi:hypothetical protein
VGGGMAEWLKAAVLKTVIGVTRSGVRIPLPPPEKKGLSRLAVAIETARSEALCKRSANARINLLSSPSASLSPIVTLTRNFRPPVDHPRQGRVHKCSV